MKKNTILLIIFALVFIEQLIKYVIRNYYMDVEFSILPPFFYFDPIVNTDFSYINNLYNLGLNKVFHLALQLTLLVIFVLVFGYLRLALPYKRMILISLLIGISGIICVFIDTAFLGGSLDYIYLKPHFTFDLKDVYLNISLIFYFLGLFTLSKDDRRTMRKTKFKDFIKSIYPKK